jgi:hypothetical protein
MCAPKATAAVEVADIFRAHGSWYRAAHPVTPQQAMVLTRLALCRTAALGGHRDHCQRCGYARISYNSCRDRHCPKCQGHKRAAWLARRLERVLPVEHFHVVFTVPDALNPLMLHNQTRLYELLFHAAAATIETLAADPRRLGAQVGLTALLHTWGQNLLFHPHLHCVVTGGGLSPQGDRWIAGRRGFFLPVKVMGRLFRGKFLAGLRQVYDAGQLRCTGTSAKLTDPVEFRRWLTPLYRREWVVYAKRPFGGATQVFRYLGRYSHRVAIANSRLIALDANRVSFRWKDYRDGISKVMELAAEEFIRRFLLHVLPPRFVRIRHYGLLAGRNVATRLQRCRQLLGNHTMAAECLDSTIPKSWSDWVLLWTGEDPLRCPHCWGPLVREPLLRPDDSNSTTTQRQSIRVSDSS